MSGGEAVLFCWSGGKDSAMALHTLLQQPGVRVVALLTTVTEGRVPGFVLANPGSTDDRIAMHGVRRELLKRQAESIGLPLHEFFIPPQCVNPIYEERMEEALRLFYNQGVRKVAFGDIFLEDLRAYREKNLARIGMTALFPIWKRDTRELIRFFEEWDRKEPMVVHCYAGISRSTAGAYIAACALNPRRDELAIARALRLASATATPNSRLVALADRVLGRDYRLGMNYRFNGRN